MKLRYPLKGGSELKNPHLHVYLSFSMSPRRGQEGRKNLERKQDGEP